MSVVFFGHRHVDDGQHHEDVGLQRDDQDMEQRPYHAEEQRDRYPARAGGREHRQQQEDDFAGVHVPVEPQAVRQRLGDEFDHLEQEVDGPQQEEAAERRDEEFLAPAAQALGLDAEDDHQRENRQRQREGGV